MRDPEDAPAALGRSPLSTLLVAGITTNDGGTDPITGVSDNLNGVWTKLTSLRYGNGHVERGQRARHLERRRLRVADAGQALTETDQHVETRIVGRRTHATSVEGGPTEDRDDTVAYPRRIATPLGGVASGG